MKNFGIYIQTFTTNFLYGFLPLATITFLGGYEFPISAIILFMCKFLWPVFILVLFFIIPICIEFKNYFVTDNKKSNYWAMYYTSITGITIGMYVFYIIVLKLKGI